MHLVYPDDERGNEQKLPGQEPGIIRKDLPGIRIHLLAVYDSFLPSIHGRQTQVEYIETMFFMLLEGKH